MIADIACSRDLQHTFAMQLQNCDPNDNLISLPTTQSCKKGTLKLSIYYLETKKNIIYVDIVKEIQHLLFCQNPCFLNLPIHLEVNGHAYELFLHNS
jgi:hypothetical protein